MCFENRRSPEHQAVTELVAGGAIGRLSFAQVTITTGYWHPTHATQSAWMYRREQGGGYLFGQMSHEIDFLRSLFGPVVAVSADVRHSLDRVATPAGDIDVTADDTSAVLMRLESGALAVLTNSSAGLAAGTNLFEIHGSNGTSPSTASRPVAARWWPPSEGATLDRSSPRHAGWRAGSSCRPGDRQAPSWPWACCSKTGVPAFSGQPTNTPAIRDGWAVQQIIDAALRSSEGAGWVDITG